MASDTRKLRLLPAGPPGDPGPRGRRGRGAAEGFSRRTALCAPARLSGVPPGVSREPARGRGSRRRPASQPELGEGPRLAVLPKQRADSVAVRLFRDALRIETARREHGARVWTSRQADRQVKVPDRVR